MIGAKVELSAVTKKYGALCALLETDLTIERGEFFSLLGPSGSGKSTLLGAVAGYIPISSGRIRIDGVDISDQAPYRRNLGMVFQNYSLFPFMNVRKNISFPLEMRNFNRKTVDDKIETILELVKLRDYENRMPAELSGGQQQRVALARAAVYDPPLLLMDEPLGALDKKLRSHLQQEIRQFQRQLGLTVIYVTHDQDEAAAMSDRIAIMQGGKIMQIGSPKELYLHPIDSFVAGFLGEGNFFDIAETNAENRRLKTSDGSVIQCEAFSEAEEGQVICVRPEKITVFKANAPTTTDNVIRGVVVDSYYSSGIIRHKILSTTGVEISSVSFAEESQVMSPGDEVQVGWNSDASQIIRRGT